MKLSSLIAPWITIESSCDISGIVQDSRVVKLGDLFLAYSGGTYDARAFIPDVLKQGAAAVLYDPINWPSELVLPMQPNCIPFPDLMMKRGEISSRFYDYPTRAFDVIGVTGTNGKTTIAYLLAQAYELLDKPSAYVGTLGQGSVSNIIATYNTTPDPLSLQHFFNESRKQGVKAMCMEVSSHALTQGRVAGVDFSYAIYSNLSHEHLDYHKTMDAYALAKAQLFACPTLKWAFINQDDAYASIMRSSIVSDCNVLTYGIHTDCDIRALDIVMGMTGSQFSVASPWGRLEVQVKLIGQFNIYNSLAVLATLFASGYDKADVLRVMSQLKASPGRMEILRENPCVIVDYAHTPDALDNALSTVSKLKKRELHVVFGCGGDRDSSKRAVMGKIASQYADKVYITSDNPRTEDPMSIIDMIKQGVLTGNDVRVEPDRKKAIHQALFEAHEDDLILIAGKGHEDYQQIGTTRFPFSDQAVVRDYYQA
jgi:UDP-N-acetylmuramoyl-L-alanyl-D-glutamate--2,6-diaminopimelate ligase